MCTAVRTGSIQRNERILPFMTEKEREREREREREID